MLELTLFHHSFSKEESHFVAFSAKSRFSRLPYHLQPTNPWLHFHDHLSIVFSLRGFRGYGVPHFMEQVEPICRQMDPTRDPVCSYVRGFVLAYESQWRARGASDSQLAQYNSCRQSGNM